MASMIYKEAGVDIQAGDQLVDWLSSSANSESAEKNSHQDKVVQGIGGFASLFRLQFPEIKKPLLVSCTDGVGTKVKLAAQYKSFFSVAQDMVAMCVNDLICTGGVPLFFLDYYAVAKLELEHAKEFLRGVRTACAESDCVLIGGETAEMPGVYQKGEFDCAGFAVGIVDEDKTIGAHRAKAGDVVIGVGSSGFHSNGYSLLRKVFADDLDNWSQSLLVPTSLYVKLAKEFFKEDLVHGLAHITGGGIENVPRVLPENLEWQMKKWQWPEPFLEVQRRTGLSDAEMLTTLNCGIGLVVIAPASNAQRIWQIIVQQGFKAYDLGQLRPRSC